MAPIHNRRPKTPTLGRPTPGRLSGTGPHTELTSTISDIFPSENDVKDKGRHLRGHGSGNSSDLGRAQIGIRVQRC